MAMDRGRKKKKKHSPASVCRMLEFAGVLLAACIATAEAAERCTPAFGRVVSVQGNVETQPAGGSWQATALNATLCAGDMVRVHQRSRAALLLSNETTLRLDQGTTLMFVAPGDKNTTMLEQISGGVHVITRTPKAFKVKTPFVNANVEGTEFLVRVTENDASVAVYEGKVVAENDQASLTISGGEQVTAGGSAAPRKSLLVRPQDAVTWTLYFPTIFDERLGVGTAGTPAESARLRSVDLYRRGMLPAALAELETVSESERTPGLLTYRAGLLLSVGRLDEAQPSIEHALRLDPGNAEAYALLAVTAVVGNDKVKALEFAEKATNAGPTSPVALIARSYAQQADFKNEQALSSTQAAVDADPRNALAWARLAELHMAGGNLRQAEAAAARALAENPLVARTQTVFGFAHLLRINTLSAKQSFARAIELDEADPLARLGLGLAQIRDGDLAGGRQEIEIAAALDPANSLIRSYLGKAYYEEKRDAQAGPQFFIAKRLDPNDPTPNFYDAIRKQTENRPVEALIDLDRSIALNDNRAVYRSRFLLDDDKATRTTGASAIYDDLGFEWLAIGESIKAIAEHFGNDAAHRQLAIAYRNLERHDVARVSESLQAQLRQPLTASPLSPQITSDNLSILRDTGPAQLGANEFNQLFSRKQLRVQLGLIDGNRGVSGDTLVVSGLKDAFAFAFSQLHYQKAGFQEHDELKKDIYSAFAQVDLSPRSSVQLELRRTSFEVSQIFNRFDPDPLNQSQARTGEDSDIVRLGGRFDLLGSSNLIYNLTSERRTRSVYDIPTGFLVVGSRGKATSFELQQLWRVETGLQLLAGLRHLDNQDDFDGGFGQTSNRSRDIYLYSTWSTNNATLHAGASYDDLVVTTLGTPLKRNRFSPKLGTVWSLLPNTTLRFAAFSAIKRRLIGSATIEPTQVAGFNQFFTGFDALYGDVDGTISKRVGLGIDQRFSSQSFGGFEVTSRRLDVPSYILSRDFPWKERSHHAYFYRILPSVEGPSRRAWQMALSAELLFENIDRPAVLTGVEGIRLLQTYQLPLALKVFSDQQWSSKLGMTYVRQRGIFTMDEGATESLQRASAWITDLSIDYRLPRRSGVISLGAKNLFDKHVAVFETDPVNPRNASRRVMYAKVRFVL